MKITTEQKEAMEKNLKDNAIAKGRENGLRASQSVFNLDGMVYGFAKMKGKKHARFEPLYRDGVDAKKVDCLIHKALWNGVKIF